MALTTYGKAAEMTITQYGKKYRSDNFTYTQRHVAEMWAQEVAFFAKMDAFENGNLGEAVFANDQFITTYTNVPLQTDSNGSKYIEFPNAPAGMPKGREISYINLVGNLQKQIIPMQNKDRFMQNMTYTPTWMSLYYVENGRIVFTNLGQLSGNMNLGLVGAVPTGSNLLDLPLNIPKSTESLILDKILTRMSVERPVLPDNVNDNVSK